MIHVLLIYEKVNLVMPLEQRKFFHYLNDTLLELKALYYEKNPALLLCECAPDNQKEDCFDENFWPWRATSLDEYLPFLGLYLPAIVDNILFLAGAGDGYKSEFLRKAEEAYLSYWKKKSRGGRIKRAGW